MKLLKFLGRCAAAILTAVMVIGEVLEFLALPAILMVIGIICDMPPAFYWVVILGYLAIFAAFQLLLWLLEKKLGKHFDALLTHRIEKIAKRLKKE